MEKKKEIITCQPRICSFLCSLARYVGSLFPLVLIYTTRATLMTLMKFISSTCYTQYYRKVYIQCQIRTLEHAIRGKTINRLFLFFFLRVLLANAILDILDKHKSKVIGNLPTGLSIMYQLYFRMDLSWIFSKWLIRNEIISVACISFWIPKLADGIFFLFYVYF